MKKLFQLFSLLSFVMVMTACSGSHDDVTPVDESSNFQKAIDTKFISLGWDKDGHTPFNGSLPVKTAGGTGYVQYYALGSAKAAIYYFPGKGAFAMNTSEMNFYDAAGQDKWALVVSDAKSCGSGCGYNDIVKTADNTEGVIILNTSVTGEIYKKYKALNRWEGPLGIPEINESDLGSKKGRYIKFTKGQIYYNTSTGAQAFWGKIQTLYEKAGYDQGWLGLPTTSCDMNVAEGKQYIRLQNGAIDGASCGNYYGSGGLLRYVNGTSPTNGAVPPCY